MMKSFNHEVAIFNFWATWCKPCIEEMPYLEEVRKSYTSNQLGVYLISMDNSEVADTKVKKFIEKKGYTSRVLLLDETDYNSFIDKIDPKWNGTIPATVIIDKKNGKKYFYEGSFKENELKEILAKTINP
jgi:thiol-disulfide isomerase/thioredoxin